MSLAAVRLLAMPFVAEDDWYILSLQSFPLQRLFGQATFYSASRSLIKAISSYT
jgi:hypothetical protein